MNAMAAYEADQKQPSLTGFLDDVSLGNQEFDNEKEKQLKRNCVALMTLHSAKGLEFPHVYLVGLEEGILPHHRSLGDDEAGVPEERRLCYVGITRAQERLTLSFPMTRMKWGKPRPTIASRFLFEAIGQADNVGSGGAPRAVPRAARTLAGRPAAPPATRKVAARYDGANSATRRPAAAKRPRPGTTPRRQPPG
ncbi:MAG: 3'-5' exonuclease [Pirellulaceae bacterium]